MKVQMRAIVAATSESDSTLDVLIRVFYVMGKLPKVTILYADRSYYENLRDLISWRTKPIQKESAVEGKNFLKEQILIRVTHNEKGGKN